MKNVYRATRPVWSRLDKSETKVIFLASALITGYETVAALITSWISKHYSTDLIELHLVWSIFDLVVLTTGCLLAIWFYKKLSVGCYPTTFMYCFFMPGESNPSGKSQVVGFCHIKPNLSDGEMEAVGASFFWDDGQLNTASRVGFKSTRVRGSKEDEEETTCHIHFEIDPEDIGNRNYSHGVLKFRLDKTSGFKAEEGRDVYAGYLQSTHSEEEAENIDVRSRGFAEWLGKGHRSEIDIEGKLRQHGDELFHHLNAMLKAKPQPTIWEGKAKMHSKQKNFWGHSIPTPQAVALNQSLKPLIDKLLNKVLSLAGLDEFAIGKFRNLVTIKATLDSDDTRVAYERDLKAGLIGLTSLAKLNATLFTRAEIIKKQIEPYLVGESLLDIGCGNGMVANLIRGHFKHNQIQVLDVVEYVPPGYGLNFKLYKEGEPLAVDHSFDTVLLLTVLHHSYNPLELLKLAWGATSKRLIIIESVIGVHNLEPEVKYELADSTDEDQIAFAAFVDWFYNRVLHDDVPVPYNFTTPSMWKSVFAEQNMKVVQTIHLGQDIEIGPEYHILFVLEKE